MLQQQTYHGGTATPEGLAQYLVSQFEQTRRQRAQVIGEGGSLLIQIGRENRAPALTVAIAHQPETPQDITVTMGEQQWLESGNEHAIVGTMIGALFTPWALFGLLGPLRDNLESGQMNRDVWNMVNTYLIGQGATLVKDQEVNHPHFPDQTS